MKALENKNIIIGVTGGIAAYKACDVINQLKKRGANINVIMTKNATKFITPLTLETLSNNLVVTDMFEDKKTWDVEHISLAQKADLILVVPATANIIGKVANGIADDMLSTVLMATRAPIVFVPAMNNQMWENFIVQENVKKLKDYWLKLGIPRTIFSPYYIIEPEEGMLACGYKGKGVLAKVQNIIKFVEDYFNKDVASE